MNLNVRQIQLKFLWLVRSSLLNRCIIVNCTSPQFHSVHSNRFHGSQLHFLLHSPVLPIYSTFSASLSHTFWHEHFQDKRVMPKNPKEVAAKILTYAKYLQMGFGSKYPRKFSHLSNFRTHKGFLILSAANLKVLICGKFMYSGKRLGYHF